MENDKKEIKEEISEKETNAKETEAKEVTGQSTDETPKPKKTSTNWIAI